MQPPKVLLRRFVSIAGLLISSLYAAVFLMLPNIIFIEPFFKKLAFRIHYKIASIWFRLVLFIFEVVNNIEIRFYGDDIPEGESLIMMMNHPSEVDWLFTFSVAYRKKALSKIKVLLKNEVRLVPGVGWGCDNLDYIFLSRDWSFDEQHIEYKLNKFKENDFKPWLVIFPEGTDIDEEKLKKSWAFAEKNGYPKFNNVLLPRHKGLHACVEPLRDTVDSVYDVTIGYESKPTIFSCISGSNPKTVHLHFKRYALNEIPSNENDLQQWLFKLYDEKDKLLQDLKENGQYSMPYIKSKFEPSLLLTSLAWFYYLIIPCTHLLIASLFVKLYFIGGIIYYILNSKVEILRTIRGLQKVVYKPKPKQV